MTCSIVYYSNVFGNAISTEIKQIQVLINDFSFNNICIIYDLLTYSNDNNVGGW